ncbi:MAG: N-acetylneuraminate synthase family protein [Chthoniobacterales bacterium]|nr:N-acetylneuraminate synthase family protein [Chthoniobacterales bacterium]
MKTSRSFDIGARSVGANEKVFVIAEIGVNHDGCVERALQLVDIAADCGAEAVKLQIFRAQKLMHGSSAFAGYQKQQCADATPADILKRYELKERELAAVIDAIRDRGLIPLATPFSPEDVATIMKLGLPAIKIASPDLANPVLLGCAALSGKPLIISTGAAEMAEVASAAKLVRGYDVPLALLHCVSSYPALADDANLCWIDELATSFACPVGYSDHTTDALSVALAVAAGACIIEKHLTYDRVASGPDHSTSADPKQFAECVRVIRLAERLRGRAGKHVLPCEKDVRNVSRQSLVLRRRIDAGQELSMRDLTVQRPGTGIPAAALSLTIGRRTRRGLEAGTLLRDEMLSGAA